VKLGQPVPLSNFSPERNSGSPFQQWRKGVELARGEIVWIAESDDYADPQFLELLVAALEAHPHAGLAYCRSLLVDDTNVVLRDSLAYTARLDPERWKHDFVNDGKAECARYLVRCNTIPNASAVLVRRQSLCRALDKADPFVVCGDWMIWASILLSCQVVYRAAALNFFRHHANAVRVSTQRALRLQEAMRIQLFLCRNVEVPADVLEVVRGEAGRRVVQAILGREGLDSISSRGRVCWIATRIYPQLWGRLLLQFFGFRPCAPLKPDGSAP